eukprot:scaffold34931_cov38-Cyclotella_meneghiniana.AAC.3
MMLQPGHVITLASEMIISHELILLQLRTICFEKTAQSSEQNNIIGVEHLTINYQESLDIADEPVQGLRSQLNSAHANVRRKV